MENNLKIESASTRPLAAHAVLIGMLVTFGGAQAANWIRVGLMRRSMFLYDPHLAFAVFGDAVWALLWVGPFLLGGFVAGRLAQEKKLLRASLSAVAASVLLILAFSLSSGSSSYSLLGVAGLVFAVAPSLLGGQISRFVAPPVDEQGTAKATWGLKILLSLAVLLVNYQIFTAVLSSPFPYPAKSCGALFLAEFLCGLAFWVWPRSAQTSAVGARRALGQAIVLGMVLSLGGLALLFGIGLAAWSGWVR